MLKISIFLIGIMSMVGCATSSPSKSNLNPVAANIAIMPLDNQTNSVAGALYMREELVTILKSKGYEPMLIHQVDLQLANQLGLSLGGQILVEDIPKIAATLGVSKIIVGRLRNFEAILMSYNHVSANFTMYNADAQVIWTYSDDVSVPFSPIRSDDMSTRIIGGLLSNVIDRSAGRPQREAVEEYYKRLQRSLPLNHN